jgi:hypothetical protein
MGAWLSFGFGCNRDLEMSGYKSEEIEIEEMIGWEERVVMASHKFKLVDSMRSLS